MGISIGTILTILLIVWWIVSAVISAASKQKEQQRLNELAKRRSAETAPDQQPRQRDAPPRSDRPVSAQTTQLDDLRRRREAQIEELRRRRQAATPAPKTQVGRPARQPASVPTRAGAQRRKEPQPVMRQSSPPTRPAVEPPKPVEVSPPAARPPAIAAASPAEVTRSTRPTPPRAAAIREFLTKPESLRHAMVLKEILDPPVGLRP